MAFNTTIGTNNINDTDGIDLAQMEEGLGPFPERAMVLSMFKDLRQDKYGNVTVDGLAKEALLSRTCKAWLRLARETATIYDAKIIFDKGNNDVGGMPRYFVGGVSFGEFEWFPALCIIRHPRNGRTFIVSVKPHLGFEKYGSAYEAPVFTPEQCSDPTYGLDNKQHRFEVNRIFKIGELAGLLNGHCADFQRRLPDLRKFHYGSWNYDEYTPLQGRALVPNVFDALPYPDMRDELLEVRAFLPQKRAETGAQLVTRSVNEIDGRMETHYGDFITWEVLSRSDPVTIGNGDVRMKTTYLQTPKLVLFETDAGAPGMQEPVGGWPRSAKYIPPERTWCGPNQVAICLRKKLRTNPADFGPGEPSTLAICLGMLSENGTGAGWWPSIFVDHHCGKYEKAYYRMENGHYRQTAAELALEKQAKWFPDWHDLLTTDETLKKMGDVAMRAHKYLQQTALNSRTTREYALLRSGRAAKQDAIKRIDRYSGKSTDDGRLVVDEKDDSVQAGPDPNDGYYDAQFASTDEFVSLSNQRMADADDDYLRNKMCAFAEEAAPRKKAKKARAVPAPSRSSGAGSKRTVITLDPNILATF